MQIQKSGKTNDLFIEELQKRMPKTAEAEAKVEDTPKETQLEDARKREGEKAEADGITEKQLPENGEREDKPVEETFEGQLDKSRKESRAAAPNVEKQGITEERLNDASKELYPHRNEKAYERTGDKRPINALREEMGNASDAAKRERYEKANTSGKKRLVDENVGSQLTNSKSEIKTLAFNFKKQKTAKQETVKDYLEYKASTEVGIKTASVDKFAEVKELDSLMSDILASAENEKRILTEDEMAKIAAFKSRKSEILLKEAKEDKKKDYKGPKLMPGHFPSRTYGTDTEEAMEGYEERKKEYENKNKK